MMASDFTIDTITVLQLKELLGKDIPPLVLDVREAEELKICSLPTYTHISLGGLQKELDQLPRDRVIVTLCHHGRRSLQAALLLKHHGFGQVLNLVGGIQAWAEQVDPLMTQY